VLTAPLSFWGGVDAERGVIIDRRHPQRGQEIGGRILVMPAGRGSSSSASVLAELIRLGVGPAGIVLQHADEIVMLGALAAELLYGVTCPVVVVDTGAFGAIAEGSLVGIDGEEVTLG
jgi:predicted aconitase with swiveling domain